MSAKFGTNASGVLFSWRYNSSYRINTLGPLFFWGGGGAKYGQCLNDLNSWWVVATIWSDCSDIIVVLGRLKNWLKMHTMMTRSFAGVLPFPSDCLFKSDLGCQCLSISSPKHQLQGFIELMQTFCVRNICPHMLASVTFAIRLST